MPKTLINLSSPFDEDGNFDAGKLFEQIRASVEASEKAEEPKPEGPNQPEDE